MIKRHFCVVPIFLCLSLHVADHRVTWNLYKLLTTFRNPNYMNNNLANYHAGGWRMMKLSNLNFIITGGGLLGELSI